MKGTNCEHPCSVEMKTQSLALCSFYLLCEGHECISLHSPEPLRSSVCVCVSWRLTSVWFTLAGTKAQTAQFDSIIQVYFPYLPSTSWRPCYFWCTALTFAARLWSLDPAAKMVWSRVFLHLVDELKSGRFIPSAHLLKRLAFAHFQTLSFSLGYNLSYQKTGLI